MVYFGLKDLLLGLTIIQLSYIILFKTMKCFVLTCQTEHYINHATVLIWKRVDSVEVWNNAIVLIWKVRL